MLAPKMAPRNAPIIALSARFFAGPNWLPIAAPARAPIPAPDSALVEQPEAMMTMIDVFLNSPNQNLEKGLVVGYDFGSGRKNFSLQTARSPETFGRLLPNSYIFGTVRPNREALSSSVKVKWPVRLNIDFRNAEDLGALFSTTYGQTDPATKGRRAM